MNTPLVSALVTVYNRQHILNETVESLLGSSCSDIEIILADDCSLDGSWSLCQNLQVSCPRVRAFRNLQNLGDYANRNRAASLARGKYLKYLDADDLIYPHSLQVMVDALEKFPTAGLALSANVIDPEVPYPEKLDPPEFFRRHFLGRSPIGVGPHGLKTVTIPSLLDKASLPYDAYAYVGAPAYEDAAGGRFSQPRMKDKFILISAGPDRRYGTDDDITNFGSLR